MSDLKFYCPRCDQKIQCDEQWSGLKIQCPACQGDLIVPHMTAAPIPAPQPAAPPPIPQPTLSAPRPHAVPPSNRPASTPRTPTKPPSFARAKSNSKAKVIKITAVSLVGAIACYFGFRFAVSLQNSMNRKADKMAKESDGGEAGHIATLYQVLDATDTDRRGRISMHPDAPDPQVLAARQARRDASTRAEQAQQSLPVLPAVWTLDLQSASIPEGRANGMLSGTNFLVEAARIDKVGDAYALSLRQGSGLSADREIVVYLKLKPGETLGGHTWAISKDMPAGKAPQIVKRWKTDPKFAPKQKAFPNGYAMKLEFGQPTDDVLIGKVFVALPDTEESVVAGIFRLAVDTPVMAVSFGDDQ